MSARLMPGRGGRLRTRLRPGAPPDSHIVPCLVSPLVTMAHLSTVTRPGLRPVGVAEASPGLPCGLAGIMSGRRSAPRHHRQQYSDRQDNDRTDHNEYQAVFTDPADRVAELRYAIHVHADNLLFGDSVLFARCVSIALSHQ
jgi:hypothetical protein